MSDHDSPQRFIEITRARCIARYRMHSIPGIPEELETNVEIDGVKRRISFAYSGGDMRIRKHGGPTNRQWVDTCDFRLRDGWLDAVYDYLDSFLRVEKAGTSRGAPVLIAERDDAIEAYVDRPTPLSVRPRPIRDNPQA